MHVLSWTQNRRLFTLSLLFGLLLAMLVLFFLTQKRTSPSQLALQTHKSWERYEKDPSLENLQILDNVLQRSPSLFPSYQAKIAQRLLCSPHVDRAASYLKAVYQRTHLHPLYQQYAQTSLTIGERDYPQALEQAEKLDKHLKTNPLPQIDSLSPAIGSTLLAANMVRIALLYQKVKDAKKELGAWKALSSSPYSEGFENICETIQTGNLSFRDYVNDRTIFLISNPSINGETARS